MSTLAAKRPSPCTPPGDSCCPPSPKWCTTEAPAGSTRLDALVAAYMRNVRPRRATERTFDTSHKDLATATSYAALALTAEKKRHPHQRRIPGHALAEAEGRLQRSRLREHDSFTDLHDAIDKVRHAITGLGELWAYDTAHRIGTWLGLEPELVYLHGGTRHGARNLGLDYRAPCLPMDAMPAELRKLTPAECEDFLCIYKDALRVEMNHAP